MVSVIIPSLEPHNVGWLSTHLLEQTSEDLEIISVVKSRALGYVVSANQGLKAALGNYLVVMNDDVTYVEPTWATQLTSSGLDIASSRPYEGEAFAGWCVGFTLSAYHQLGGFSSKYIHWQADVDLLERCKKIGMKWGATDAEVRHDRSAVHRASLRHAAVVQRYTEIDHETRQRDLCSRES